MPTLRDLFHSLVNTYNKISVASGDTRDSLELEPLDNLPQEKLKEKNLYLIGIFQKLQQYVREADQTLDKIKKITYSLIDPDKEY
jgi:hypothetical protein